MLYGTLNLSGCIIYGTLTVSVCQPERNTIYWHYSVPPLPEAGEEGTECFTCSLSVLIKPSLMEIVETLNPGQPPLPDWVYNGAILGRPRPRIS